MKLFFDTSALVKFFHTEQGSNKVEALIMDRDNSIWVLNLAKIEFVSALHRRYRSQELSEESLKVAITGFDLQMTNFNVEPLGISVAKEAELMIKKYGQHEGLRTLDALHLAAFSLLQENDWYFVGADIRLEKIAHNVGFKTINPLSQ